MADNIQIDVQTTVQNIDVNVTPVSAGTFGIEYSYPAGPQGPAGVNEWGTIVGTLSTQTDLWKYLSAETFSPSQLTAFLNTNAVTLCSLNVNGTILSAGVNLFDIFITSAEESQTLSYTPSSYNLSISNGNTVNLSSINSAYQTVSSSFATNTTLNSVTGQIVTSVLPTVTNYLSTNNILISSTQITTNLFVSNINKNIITTTYYGNLFGYNFAPLINSLNNTAAPTLITSSVSAELMTRQAGIGGFASTIGWGSTNYAVGGSNTVTDAINANEWFSIPVWSSQSNTTVTISSIGSFLMIRSPAGPKSVAFGYNNSGNNPSTATYLTLGVSAIPINDILTDISPVINQTLSANPITITPGLTSYIYIIPYQATGNGGTLRFQGGSSPYDLYFIGQSVNVNASNASLNLNGNITFTGNLSSTNDIEITNSTKGIILKAPNNTKWRVTITNSGTLTSVQI